MKNHLSRSKTKSWISCAYYCSNNLNISKIISSDQVKPPEETNLEDEKKEEFHTPELKKPDGTKPSEMADFENLHQTNEICNPNNLK